MDVLCAIVPRFLVAFARLADPDLRDRPVLVGQSSETRGNVVACSEEASSAGVRPGMPITRALVLSPSAAVIPSRPEQIELAAQQFRAAAVELFPIVEAVEPGHIHADVRGMARLTGRAPAAYREDVHESFSRRTGLPVQIGAAPTVFAAHVAASYLSRPVKLLSGTRIAGFLSGLPVDALPVDEAVLRRLRLFGLETLQQVGALPAAALQSQFGPTGLRMWRLIHGHEQGSIRPGLDELRVTEQMDLPGPAVQSMALVLATEILLKRALHRPDINGRSLRRMDWVATLENDERLPLRCTLREPTAEPERMLFLLRTHIERQTLAAPAIGVELGLSGICSEYARQERLWQTGPRESAALGDAIEHLSVRTGGPQVYRIVEVEPWSRIPERQRALAAYSP